MRVANSVHDALSGAVGFAKVYHPQTNFRNTVEAFFYGSSFLAWHDDVGGFNVRPEQPRERQDYCGDVLHVRFASADQSARYVIIFNGREEAD